MSNVIDYLTFVADVQEKNGLPKGWRVVPARWLLEHGVHYSEHAEVPDWMMGEPQSCFANAGSVALLHDHDHKYTYVEGFITVHGVPIAHAWLVDEHDRIYEVTIADLGGVDDYFGAPLNVEFLRETVIRTETWGVLDPMFNSEMYMDEEAVI